jgi:hypothetical protein
MPFSAVRRPPRRQPFWSSQAAPSDPFRLRRLAPVSNPVRRKRV